jgi:hypothetical protein
MVKGSTIVVAYFGLLKSKVHSGMGVMLYKELSTSPLILLTQKFKKPLEWAAAT